MTEHLDGNRVFTVRSFDQLVNICSTTEKTMPQKGRFKGVTIANYTAAKREGKKPTKDATGSSNHGNQQQSPKKKRQPEEEEKVVDRGLCMNERCLEELEPGKDGTLVAVRTKIFNKFHAFHTMENGTEGYTCCMKCDHIVKAKIRQYSALYDEENYLRRLKEGKLLQAEGTIPNFAANSGRNAQRSSNVAD